MNIQHYEQIYYSVEGEGFIFCWAYTGDRSVTMLLWRNKETVGATAAMAACKHRVSMKYWVQLFYLFCRTQFFIPSRFQILILLIFGTVCKLSDKKSISSFFPLFKNLNTNTSQLLPFRQWQWAFFSPLCKTCTVLTSRGVKTVNTELLTTRNRTSSEQHTDRKSKQQ